MFISLLVLGQDVRLIQAADSSSASVLVAATIMRPHTKFARYTLVQMPLKLEVVDTAS